MAEVPLRWGTARDRMVLGLALILGGAIGVQGVGPYILWLLPVGTVLHAAGWAILPSDGWRRVTAASVSSGVVWVVLAGPQFVWLFAASYACWLLVRRRPLRAWFTLALPILCGALLAFAFREYSGMPFALGIQLVVLVVAAWLAALIASGGTAPSQSRG